MLKQRQSKQDNNVQIKNRMKQKGHIGEIHLHHCLWERAFIIFWNADMGNQPIPLSSDHAIRCLGNNCHQDIMGLWSCAILNDKCKSIKHMQML